MCLWFLARDKRDGRYRDRRGETLFIDARKLGSLVDRTHRELSDEEIARIAATYHAWRGDAGAGGYADEPGFCRSATIDEIRGHGHVLTPGRYVGAADAEEDDEPFDEKMRAPDGDAPRAGRRGPAARRAHRGEPAGARLR